MVASLLSQVTADTAAAQRQLPPLVILVLCILAGIGTILLLPSRREAAIRKIGGALLVVTGLVFLLLLIRLAAGSAQTTSGRLGPYFWMFASLALAGALRVVTHPRPVYSALYFVMTVMASAGLFVLLQADFMAAALIIVYAGAILITYVFVIMLAAQTIPSDKPLAGLIEYDVISREPLLSSAIGFTLAGVLLFVLFDRAQGLPPAGSAAGGLGTADALAGYLFTRQVVSLEIAGLILTLSMVGAIIIARRRVVGGLVTEQEPTESVLGPATPVDDNPHSIPVYGTDNPRAKAYPET